ncbi:MAG: hypothetical protein EHM20_00025 [Alphaproteobacteria bacterium]|nr:MAG: hypothetical protein EHM20_00025 [Alphaproteobacteria bacterium]
MRKINFKEILLVSRILREMGTKSYAEYATRLVERVRKDKNKSKEEQDKLIGTDVGIFILENLEIAKDALFELFASYNEISIEEAQKMDFDQVVATIQNMISAGLPDAIIKLLKKTGINFLAKSNV